MDIDQWTNGICTRGRYRVYVDSKMNKFCRGPYGCPYFCGNAMRRPCNVAWARANIKPHNSVLRSLCLPPTHHSLQNRIVSATSCILAKGQQGPSQEERRQQTARPEGEEGGRKIRQTSFISKTCTRYFQSMFDTGPSGLWNNPSVGSKLVWGMTHTTTDRIGVTRPRDHRSSFELPLLV